MTKMIQNEDIQIRFTITSEGVAIPISSINDYHVYVYYLNNGIPTLIATYKKANTDEFKIVVDDGPNGKITIVLSRNLTRTLKPGKIYAEVKIQLTADSDFVDSKSNKGVNQLLIDEIVASPNPNILT